MAYRKRRTSDTRTRAKVSLTEGQLRGAWVALLRGQRITNIARRLGIRRLNLTAMWADRGWFAPKAIVFPYADHRLRVHLRALPNPHSKGWIIQLLAILELAKRTFTQAQIDAEIKAMTEDGRLKVKTAYKNEQRGRYTWLGAVEKYVEDKRKRDPGT